MDEIWVKDALRGSMAIIMVDVYATTKSCVNPQCPGAGAYQIDGISLGTKTVRCPKCMLAVPRDPGAASKILAKTVLGSALFRHYHAEKRAEGSTAPPQHSSEAQVSDQGNTQPQPQESLLQARAQ